MQLEALTIFSQTNDICQYDGSALLVVLSMAILYVSLVVFHLHRNSTIHSRALTRKDDFVSRSGNDYGYATSQRGHINTWRGTEFPNLISPLVRSTKISSTTAQGEELIVYLDYAGAALPAKTQLQNIFEKVPAILANPHSTGPAASKSSLLIEQAKTRILDLLNGHPSRIKNHVGYEVLFTSGTTEALRIVAERFPWCRRCDKCGISSKFMYSNNSHTSVVGMRECALANGGTYESHPLAFFHNETSWCTPITHHSCGVNNLLVLPVECNFDGERTDLSSVIQLSQKHTGWYTLLDIAKAASTSPVDLHALDPDFACLSFYKLFGTPTGLGALLVKRTARHLFTQKSTAYFGGGSVDMVLPTMAVRKSGLVSHGTVHFRGVAELMYGFDELDKLGGMMAIQRHTLCLTNELVRRLLALRHFGGMPVVQLYGPWSKNEHQTTTRIGPIVPFNLLRNDGSYIGYNEVSKLAALHSPPLQLRTGCFCNPGACQEALGLDDDEMKRNYEVTGHVCGDHMDIIHGRPTGAIRVSLGKDSLWEDVDALVSFIETTFVSKTAESHIKSSSPPVQEETMRLTELYIFPIKSCAAQRVSMWRMPSSTGKLEFDREFALIDSSGTAMRLQSYPQMSQIRPAINLATLLMTVSAPGMPDITIDINKRQLNEDDTINSVVQVCGNKCGGRLWGDSSASDWFSNFLGVQCWLARHNGTQDSTRSGVAFANEESLLLLSEHAVAALNDVMRRQGHSPAQTRHFRPNLVVRTTSLTSIHGHLEDKWTSLTLSRTNIKLNVVGECPRCAMVDVDPTSGTKGNTLRALANYRRRQGGRIMFGIFLRRSASEEGEASPGVWIKQGDLLICK